MYLLFQRASSPQEILFDLLKTGLYPLGELEKGHDTYDQEESKRDEQLEAIMKLIIPEERYQMVPIKKRKKKKKELKCLALRFVKFSAMRFAE